MKTRNRFVALVTSIALGVTACASSTVIRSNAPNTKVYLDGQFVGNAPYTMTDTKIVGSTTEVRLEAPGYAPTTSFISRSEKFSIIACIGGAFVLVPFLWIMEYNPDHMFQLQPAGAYPQAPSGYPQQGQPQQYPQQGQPQQYPQQGQPQQYPQQGQPQQYPQQGQPQQYPQQQPRK